MCSNKLALRWSEITDEVETHEIQGRKIVPKLWGYEEWIVNNDLYCGKILYIRPGLTSSLHYHKIKDETFMVQEGVVRLVKFDIVADAMYPNNEHPPKIEYLRGWAHDSARLRPFQPHAFQAINEPAVVLEFSTQHFETDVVRLEPSRVLL